MSFQGAVQPRLVELVAKVGLNPDSGRLPGDDALQKLLNGAARLALLACLGAFIWGAAQWALGSRSHNYSQASDGKTRMLAAVGGVFAIGAAAAIINFFFDAGAGVK